jgi:acetoin utilization deacetylase AcuC-like enzyme
MTTGLVWDERFAWHDAGLTSTHPWAEPYPALDRPEAKRRLWSLLQASSFTDRLVPIKARPASEEELCRFHTPDYVARVRRLSETGGGEAGENARFGPNGFAVASLAAGACIEGAEAVLSGRIDNAYALVRPCGHHAEAERGRGFCLFANVVLAIEHVRAVHDVRRIAVVDWDVHHGNGTEAAFYADPGVFTISLHQDRCYPADTGGIEAIGTGAGRGFNLNLPLPPGSGHGAYLAAFERVVVPAVAAFHPEFIVVACGYDAAASDPLGRMLCTSETFRAMTRYVGEAANRFGAPILVCQEGGYSPTYAPFCGLAVIEELVGERSGVEDPLAGWYAGLGGQALQPHQKAIIELVAERLRVAA